MNEWCGALTEICWWEDWSIHMKTFPNAALSTTNPHLDHWPILFKDKGFGFSYCTVTGSYILTQGLVQCLATSHLCCSSSAVCGQPSRSANFCSDWAASVLLHWLHPLDSIWTLIYESTGLMLSLCVIVHSIQCSDTSVNLCVFLWYACEPVCVLTMCL